MSFFTALRRAQPQAEERGLTWPGYPNPPSFYGGWNPSGVSVTLESYTRSAAASACVRVLVSTVKKLPVDQIRVDGDRRIPIPKSPIVRRPSSSVTQRGFIAQWMRSMCSAGNAYGEVVANRVGTEYPAQIELINPSRVTWSNSTGRWVPHIDGKPRDVWPNGTLWHCAATDFLPAGQPFSLSPVDLAATSIGTSLAAEEFGARFFGDGAHPTSIVYSEADLTADQARAIKNSIMSSWRGNREPAVLGAGLRHEKVSVDPKDSQFIDLLRFEVEQACRWWGVPPTMVYAAISGQNVTYSNISQADLSFLKHSVDNWLVDIEDAWSAMLPQPQQVKFNTSALLRMDEEGRWKVHDIRLRNKTTTVNAVRALEDELPFPDPEYDQPGIPGVIDQPAGVTAGGTQ